jgi:hypothetical protein
MTFGSVIQGNLLRLAEIDFEQHDVGYVLLFETAGLDV